MNMMQVILDHRISNSLFVDLLMLKGLYIGSYDLVMEATSVGITG